MSEATIEPIKRENKLLRELVEAQDRLLIAYRVGSQKLGASASLRVIKAKAALKEAQAVSVNWDLRNQAADRDG